MKAASYLLVLLFLQSTALCQASKGQGNNTTSGSCSFIAPNNSGLISISSCGGLSEKDRKVLQDAVNSINQQLAKQNAEQRNQIINALTPYVTAFRSAVDELNRLTLSLEAKQNPAGFLKPVFRENTDKLTIVLGMSRIVVPLASVTENPLRIFNLSGFVPIQIVKKDGLVQVQAFLSDDIKPAVVMDGQEFTVNNPLWDKNFDDTALEVVNERQEVVFQFVYQSNTTVVIKGTFVGRGVVLSAGNFGFDISTGSDSSDRLPITRLFLYPSLIHHGQRAPVPTSDDVLIQSAASRFSQYGSDQLIAWGHPILLSLVTAHSRYFERISQERQSAAQHNHEVPASTRQAINGEEQQEVDRTLKDLRIYRYELARRAAASCAPDSSMEFVYSSLSEVHASGHFVDGEVRLVIQDIDRLENCLPTTAR